MPIRRVKTPSERGSIKDIAAGDTPYFPPEPFELRAKQLFEHGALTNNKELQAATGFITTDYIADKNALPLSAYRIRQVVADIKSKSPDHIEQLSQEMEACISFEKSPEAVAYWKNKEARVKTASVRKTPFRRVSKAK